ncbi:MAG: ABC transporter permease, partial [Thermoanaerobaculia bacterium]
MAAGPMNWFSQVVSVTGFSLRTLPERKGSSVAAVFGIAGVVAVMVGVLSIANGIIRTMKNSAAPENAIVLRSGSDTEMMSGLSGDNAKLVAEAPGIARYTDGPIASSELFVIIDLPKRSTGTDANVPLRGVVPAAFEVRDRFRLTAGRSFEWGLNEVIVGAGAAREFAGLDLGGSLEVGQERWAIVGIFEAGGGIAESEIWCDAAVLQPAYRRGNSYQSVHAKLTARGAFEEFKDSLTTDPRLNVKVLHEDEYYSSQSAMLTNLITGLGTIVAV